MNGGFDEAESKAVISTSCVADALETDTLPKRTEALTFALDAVDVVLGGLIE